MQVAKDAVEADSLDNDGVPSIYSLIARFMGPTGPHVGPMNFAIWAHATQYHVL